MKKSLFNTCFLVLLLLLGVWPNVSFGQKNIQSAPKNTSLVNMDIDRTVNIDKEGILENNDQIEVLVASPDAEAFVAHVLPLIQPFDDNVHYTAVQKIGLLSVDSLLQYDVVWVFNVRLWEWDTEVWLAEDWSDTIGSYVDHGGRLVECEFVNSWDAYGFRGGSYIEKGMSPFNKATMDVTSSGGSMGVVAQPDHPIMSGVNTFVTDYYYQDVTVKDNATLIASYEDGHPLIAVNDKVVAFNANPIGTYNDMYAYAIMGDGFKAIYNAIVFLKNSVVPFGAPNAVQNLKSYVNEDDHITLTWKNPVMTAQLYPLTDLQKVNVYVDGSESPTYVVENPVIGGDEVYETSDLGFGVHTFRVVCENAAGEGYPATIESFIGTDVPGPVTNLNVLPMGNTSKITWNSPQTGLHGGLMGDSPITYTIQRLPDSAIIADAITDTSFVDTTIPQLGIYRYKVTSANAQGNGGVAVSAPVTLGTSIVPPYSMGFEDNENFVLWKVIDFNNDGYTWQNIATDGNTNPKSMMYAYNAMSAADDWMITPEIKLIAGKTYKVKLAAKKSRANYEENFEILLGNSSNPPEMTTVLYNTATSGNSIITSYKTFEALTTISETGSYFIGIRATSEADMGKLYVDDFEIYEMFDNDMKLVSLSGPTNAIVDKEISYKLYVNNDGATTASDYTIDLIDRNNDVIASITTCPTIEPGQYVAIDLSYTPTALGTYAIRGRINFASDQNTDNNVSDIVKLNVVEDNGTLTAEIGNGTMMDRTLPINYFFRFGTSQVVYYKENIGLDEGVVTKISYRYTFANDIVNSTIKIYMANTTEDVLTDWVPMNDLTLVFDGQKSLYASDSVVTFDIEPGVFTYDGNNLVIMIVKSYDQYIEGCYYYQTNDPQGRNCSRHYRSDSDPFNWFENGSALNYYPNISITFGTQVHAGTLSGVVSDENGNPVADAMVYYDDDVEHAMMTSDDGSYNFDFIPVGQHAVNAEKTGYVNATANVEITENTNSELNLTITSIPQVNLTGKVVSTNNTPIANAAVSLGGYATYDAVSAEDGTFDIGGVYVGKQYMLNVTVDNPGYEPYSDSIFIDADATGTVDLGNIEIQTTYCDSVYNIQIEVNAETVDVSWQSPYSKMRVSDDKFIDAVTVSKVRVGNLRSDEAEIVLVAGDVWGDGSGYQFLIDADHNTYGTIIPIDSYEIPHSNPQLYEQYFEYLIPEDAEPNPNTSHIIVNGSGNVFVPEGVYDWCIVNPEPGNVIWLVSDSGPDPAKADDFTFEGGYRYTFTMNKYGQSDGTDMNIDSIIDATYNVYRNGELLAEGLVETHFSENLPADGVYEYCVEAVTNECIPVANCKTVTIGEGGLPGDADNNGVVELADIQMVTEHIFGNNPPQLNFQNADVNHDNVLNVYDIIQIVNIILGKK